VPLAHKINKERKCVEETYSKWELPSQRHK
jgi:hypothetical protein